MKTKIMSDFQICISVPLTVWSYLPVSTLHKSELRYINRVTNLPQNSKFNPLSANFTKWSTHSNNSSVKADKLFECV